jgi:DNA-binding response OmpR family regulator
MRLLLAEDEKMLSDALVTMLTHNNYSVDAVYNGQDALDYLETGDYDGAILDIMMPKMDGLTVLRKIRAEGLTLPVIMLTAKSEVDDRVEGLDAGADDYLTKPFAIKELLARIRSMTRRHTQYSSGELHLGNITLNAERFELRAENAIRLSIKEFELMQLLIKNNGRPLETDYILQQIWPGDPSANADTVWLYISYLRNKLVAVAAKLVIEGVPGGSFTLKEDTP